MSANQLVAQTSGGSPKIFTFEEVAKHNRIEDAYIVVGENVYDVTKFAKLHPGGAAALAGVAGKDATQEFIELHGPHVLSKYSHLMVGTVQRAGKEKSRTTYSAIHTDISKPFGCSIPFSEPYWYTGQPTPYYKKTHAVWRAYVRSFVDRELMPFAHQWDESGTYPHELHAKMADAGFYYASARYALKPHGDVFGKPTFGDSGLDFAEFDEFHDVILGDEMSRPACGGVLATISVAFAISVPPIMLVGSEAIKQRLMPDLLAGRKLICLAISEPYVGSDVAGLRTTATRVRGGAGEEDYYVVNGAKKFITGGVKADYCIVAVRTGGPGVGGISLLLVDKGAPGFQSRKLKTQGWLCSNTALLTFDNVRVPASNLIGEEGQGFLPIMYQFNKERYMAIISTTRMARVCIEDAVKHGRTRKTFGKRLMDHQVLRHKVVEMARQVEANQAHMELLAHQMIRDIDQRQLSKYMGLLKVQCTKTLEFCAREASQILGGASYVRGGVGERVERIYREVRVNAIGGGSEEVMMDLVAKQANL